MFFWLLDPDVKKFIGYSNNKRGTNIRISSIFYKTVFIYDLLNKGQDVPIWTPNFLNDRIQFFKSLAVLDFWPYTQGYRFAFKI